MYVCANESLVKLLMTRTIKVKEIFLRKDNVLKLLYAILRNKHFFLDKQFFTLSVDYNQCWVVYRVLYILSYDTNYAKMAPIVVAR